MSGPTYKCKLPTCFSYLDRPGYCSLHSSYAYNAERQSKYDKYKRDPEATKFYNSALWRKTSKLFRQANPICEVCKKNRSAQVHHKTPLKDLEGLDRYNADNLQAICLPCHAILERRKTAAYSPTDWDSLRPKKASEDIADKGIEKLL